MAECGFSDGILPSVKKTLNIDENILRQAKEACGASTDTETVRLGLEALIRQSAYQRLRQLRGSEKKRPMFLDGGRGHELRDALPDGVGRQLNLDSVSLEPAALCGGVGLFTGIGAK